LSTFKKFPGHIATEDFGFMTAEDSAKLNGISDGYVSQNNPRLPTSPVITSHGSAVSGDAIRLVSTGVLAQAKADSVSNAASVIGMWDGTQVLPFSSQPIVTFDSIPIAGQPCYLSATVAGALTCAIPGVGYVSTPQDLLVLEVISATAPYRARVGINKSTTGSLSARDDFKRYAAQLTGMNLAKAEFFGSDFTPSELPQDGYTIPFGSWTLPCLPSSEYSCIYTNTVGAIGSIKKVLPASNLGTQRWAMSVRWRQDLAGYDIWFALRRANADGVTVTECCQFGFSAFVGHSANLIFGAGNYDPYLAPWTVLKVGPAYGVIGTTWHQGVMYSKGDGNIYCNLDNTGELSAPISPSAAVKFTELLINTNSNQIDWIYIVNERMDY
jgi:hypothetical protein